MSIVDEILETRRAGRAAVRSATVGDIDRLVAMGRRFITETPYGALLTPNEATMRQAAEVAVRHGVTLVAEVGGVAVGMLIAFPIQDPYSGEWLLDEVAWWVEPEYRRGTLGPRMLRVLEQIARDRGIRSVKMIAPVGTDVGRYYERHGYRAVETTYLKRLESWDGAQP